MRVRAREDEPVLVAGHGVADPLGTGPRAEEEEQERERHALAALERDPLEVAVRTVQRPDLAAVAHGDAIALELSHEVVRHRLAQISAAVQQRYERTAARQPDGGLAGRVASADNPDSRGAAQPRLRGPCGVEDAESLVLREVIAGQAAVFRTRGEEHGARGDLAV